MIDFVDLHCHMLFHVDDGAHSEEVMKSMLDMAYSDGTRYICFTPHFKIYEFESEEDMYVQMQRLDRRFKVACDYAKDKYPDLKLFLGNEIMYHSDVYSSLESKKCHFLGNTSFALVEFDPNCPKYDIESTVAKLSRKGVRPLLAHVERYSAIVKDPSFAISLKESGALLQVNARSILRFKFGKIARFLKHSFKKRLIDVVSSDAHNDSSFPPCLSKAYQHIADNYGTGYANDIFHNKPLAILNNEKVF